MKKISILLFLFVFLSPTLHAQVIKKFSKEETKFLDELAKFYDQGTKEQKKEGKEFVEALTLSWMSGEINEAQKPIIIKTCNRMLELRMRPYPQFHTYLASILAFSKTGKEHDQFLVWHHAVDTILAPRRIKRKMFQSLLDISLSLFEENALFKSRYIVWKASDDNYRFETGDEIKVIFDEIDLTCVKRNDSSVIYGTKGVYYPASKKWIGQGGKITWERAGFSEDEVYAELKSYTLETRFSDFKADSVVFYNKNYFDQPMLGALEEKVLADVKEETASYPRFDSYSKRLRIDNIFKDIDYEGGFAMYGAKFRGIGDGDQEAYMIFKYEDKPFIVASAKRFIIRPDKINANPAAVRIYWEEDSIYHPWLQLKYINEKRELSLMREQEGLGLTPFFDTYHNIDMYCEAIYWKLGEPKLDLDMIKSVSDERNAKFESNDYFSDFRYFKLQGIDEEHPLRLVKRFSEEYQTREIPAQLLAAYMHKANYLAEHLLIQLAYMGFLTYDSEKKTGYIKERLYNYLNAKDGARDYDVLEFNSVISGETNGALSLLDFDLKLRGVGRVFLSDSQNVFIYPTEQELILKKNRDFVFSGRVHAGLFDFHAKNCYFDYTKFKIEMPMIDSMSFFVYDKTQAQDMYGKYPTKRVKTVIEGLTGDILIDHPNNKSGRKPFPDYPIFNSKKESFAYYDRPSIHNGVYKRDRFYYHLEPFTIDSLDNYSTEGLQFTGYLASAGIFPDIREPLRVQEDFSLGFKTKTPAAGYPAYGGKGTYKAEIDLSHKGLRGDGSLEYLTSIGESDEFFFFPDSTVGVAHNYIIKEQKSGVEYPTVTAENVFVHWLPQKDIMHVNKIDQPLIMYAENSKMHGNLALTPSGLSGAGTMEFSDAEMDSKLFRYKSRIFDADTCDFRLKTYDMSELAFSTFNYKGHIDLDKRKGDFKSNGGASKVEFPVNQYICYMDEFEWFMDKDEIALSNKSQAVQNLDNMSMEEAVDIDLTGSEFISIHPAQDSLRFFSPKAKYSLKDNIINAQNVKMIKVADAAVFPSDGNVTILKKAEMVPLKNASILANTTTKYHKVYNSIVNIYSRKNYKAVGNYDYIDETEESQQIYFSTIAVDTTGQTYASGYISDSADFTLSPNFEFYGYGFMKANNEYLTFKGGTRIRHQCDTLGRWPLKFEAEINPREIYIPVPEKPEDITNQYITASIRYGTDSTQVYAPFLQRPHRRNDMILASANGFLTFDHVSREYRISSMEKLKQESLPGNYISLNTDDCIVYADGKIDLGTRLGQVKWNTFGNAYHYIIPDSTYFELATQMDFFFHEKALNIFQETLESNTSLPGVPLNSEVYKKALGEILGIEKADKMISELSLYGEVKRYPSELQSTIFFTDLQFEWNPATRSYVSVGDIGIGSMGKVQINKYVKGIIEIQKKRSGDNITIYLEPGEGEWYFFNYTRGLMQGISSEKDFNDIVRNTKPEDRQLKVEKGQQPYRYTLSTIRKKKSFLRKFEPPEEEEEEEEEE